MSFVKVGFATASAATAGAAAMAANAAATVAIPKALVILIGGLLYAQRTKSYRTLTSLSHSSPVTFGRNGTVDTTHRDVLFTRR
jgi:hypothetical protein